MPTAKALVLEAPRRLVPRTFAIPVVGEDDAVLRVEACGLCGTDHEQYTGHLPAGYAFVPGHESVGVIEDIGSQAADRWGVASGDRVAVEVFLSCRTCDACRKGAYNRCSRHGIGDMYGFIPADKPPSLWGGYASHQYLAPDSVVHKVPEGLDPVVATLFNPLGAGFRWASTLPGTATGDVVAVLGCGIRGLGSLIAAKEAGAAFVMVTGAGARDTERLDVARAFGADLTVDVRTSDPVAALREAAGGAADIVVDVTAKAPDALGQAVQLVKAGGTVVIAGTKGSAETPGFWPDLLVYKEVRVLGALGVDGPAYEHALAVLASGRYPFPDVPRRSVGLGGVGELLSVMAGEAAGAAPLHAVLTL